MGVLNPPARASTVGRGMAPYEVLVGHLEYRRVLARWVRVSCVLGGGGALVAAVLIHTARPDLSGFHANVLLALAAGVLVYGLLLGPVLSRWPELGGLAAGVVTASLVSLFALPVGHALSASVAQATVLIAAPVAVLYPRKWALLILLLSLGSTAGVFMAQGGQFNVDRVVTITIQTGLIAALMLWLAHAIVRLRAFEQEARAETEDTRARLAAADIRRRTFMHRMSHELRTPLNAIIGFSEMLADGLVGPLTARQQEYVGDIRSSGRHLLALVNDVLDIGRVEEGQVELECAELHLDAVAQQAVTVCRAQSVERDVRVEVTTTAEDVRLVADERKVFQVVLNLLSNALKFTPAGGRVDVVVGRAGDFLEVSVRDTGPGVDAEDEERIFRPFEQAASAAGRATGTGLGLTVARQLAESHGGSLSLRRGAAPGATFVLRLPSQPSSMPADVAHDSVSGRGRRASRFEGPGIFDADSPLVRLSGRRGLARSRARIVGMLAIVNTVGSVIPALIPGSNHVRLSGQPWSTMGGIALGLFMLRPKTFLGAKQLYVLSLAAVAAIGWYVSSVGSALSPTMAAYLMMSGICGFIFFTFRRALVMGIESVVIYGLIVTFQAGHAVPVARWVLTVSMLATGAILARWLLGMLTALVESESRARSETEEVNRRLTAAGRHRSEFLANMSHELRTPLNAIIGFSDALRQEVFGTLEPTQADYLADIETAGRHLLTLINDTLDLAKADADRLQLTVQPCVPAELVRSTVASVEELAAQRQVRLEVSTTALERRASLDARQLRRALASVLEHALVSSPVGSTVALAGSAEGTILRLAVTDAARRLEPARAERLFAAFEESGDALDAPGNTVGLALARKIAELHGGTLVVEAAPTGNCFVICVPCLEPAVAGESEAALLPDAPS